MPQEGLQQLFLELPGRQDGAAQDPALPVYVLRPGIDDDIGAIGQRLLQNGRREDIVDDDIGADRLGHLDDGREVDHLERRIGRRLEEHAFGVGCDGLAPGIEILAVDKLGADAEARQDRGDDLVAGAEQRLRGDQLVAGLELAGERAEHRRHAGSNGIAGLRTLQKLKPLLEHGDGRIAVAAIDIAVILAGKAALGGLRLVIDEARIDEERFRRLAMRRAVEPAADQLGCLAPAGGR